MKLVQLNYEKPCYKSFPIVVEVPDDFPEDKVNSLLSNEQIMDASEGFEIYDTDDPPTCTNSDQIAPNDGSPRYKLIGDELVRV